MNAETLGANTTRIDPTGSVSVVQILVRTQYGMDRYYPGNDAAKKLAEISETKTLTPRVLALAVELGHTIEVHTLDQMQRESAAAMVNAELLRK